MSALVTSELTARQGRGEPRGGAPTTPTHVRDAPMAATTACSGSTENSMADPLMPRMKRLANKAMRVTEGSRLRAMVAGGGVSTGDWASRRAQCRQLSPVTACHIWLRHCTVRLIRTGRREGSVCARVHAAVQSVLRPDKAYPTAHSWPELRLQLPSLTRTRHVADPHATLALDVTRCSNHERWGAAGD